MSCESGGLPPKRLKQYALQDQSRSQPISTGVGSNENSVINKGMDRRLKQYNLFEVDNGLRKVLERNYYDVKDLPSSDICVKCSNSEQIRKLPLER